MKIESVMSEDKATTCGLFSWRPHWLQRFANHRFYLTLYSVIGVVMGIIYSYVTVVLSTVEKQFGIQSKEAAWIYSGNEFSQIFFVVFLPLVGRVKRRPLFMGLALVLAGFGLLLMALPYFTSVSAEKTRIRALKNTAKEQKLCDSQRSNDSFCEASDEDGDLDKDWTSLTVVFAGIFVYGIGGCFYYVFGLPYGDDNSAKRDGPMQFGVIWASRLLGPAIGYLLGGACLSLYVDPGREVDFDETDPRWIGAWWLGFPVIAFTLLFFAPWFTLFPRRLRAENTDAAKMAEADLDLGAATEDDEIKSPREFVRETLKIYKRLVTLPIYMLNMGSLVFAFFGIIGFSQFLPKYLEFHYRQRASRTGVLSGVIKTIAAVLGCLVSSYVISRFKIHARKLALWCSFSGAATALAFVAFAFMSCPSLSIVGVDPESGTLAAPGCSAGCRCESAGFHPVCSADGRDFFSPCLAGCAGRDGVNFTDCACAAEDKDLGNAGRPLLAADPGSVPGSASDGFCPVDCERTFLAMLAILFVTAFLGATTRTPNTLIMIRVINPKDKAASVSFILVCLSVLGFLPAPFLYGALIDRSCVLWDSRRCDAAPGGVDQSRNCLVYDTDQLRHLLNFTTAAFMLAAAACDFGVFLLSSELELYDQGEQDQKIDRLREEEREEKKRKRTNLADQEKSGGGGGGGGGGGYDNPAVVSSEMF